MNPADMKFYLLREPRELDAVRAAHPLLYDSCLEAVPDPEDGRRVAVVCDEENTVLAVLQHQFPYARNPVHVRTLVLTSLGGMRKLLSFFQRFQYTARPYARQVRICPTTTHMVLENRVKIRDVEALLHGASSSS